MVLILPLFLQRLFNSVRLFVYRMVKRVRRIVSGQCAIARICGDIPADGDNNNNNNESSVSTPIVHTRDMTTALWEEWQKSSKLKTSFDMFSSRHDMPVDEAVSSICRIKKIDTSSSIATNLRLCIRDIETVNKVRNFMHSRSDTKFTRDDPTHESALESLWTLLLPGEERSGGKLSKEWNRVGFQQQDPASDFRGGGVLALDQLVHIASTRTSVAQRMIREPASEMSRYPWACVGINITREVLRILDTHVLDMRLYGLNVDEAVALVNDTYADIFEILHAEWIQENPENVLAFPNVFKNVMANVDQQLIKNKGVLVPPGTSA